MTRPRVTQTTKWHIHYLLVHHIAMNWHWSVSCAADDERNIILLAIEDYHNKTTIRFKQYNSKTDSDYVHITGENSGCWSYIGRIGKVSSRAKGVVKTSPAVRTEQLGFWSFTPLPNTQFHTGLTHFLNPLWAILEPTCQKCSDSITNQLWVTPMTKQWTLTADLDIWFSKYLFVYWKVCLL